MTTSAFNNNSTPAYRRAAEDVFVSLATDASRGLTKAEAMARLGSYGRNELTAEKPTRPWRKFLAQLQEVLVILMLIATGVSLALWLFERAYSGKRLPGVAPVAIQQGRRAARNILRLCSGRVTEPFRYFDKGNLVAIGRGNAVVKIGAFEPLNSMVCLSGLPGLSSISHT